VSTKTWSANDSPKRTFLCDFEEYTGTDALQFLSVLRPKQNEIWTKDTGWQQSENTLVYASMNKGVFFVSG